MVPASLRRLLWIVLGTHALYEGTARPICPAKTTADDMLAGVDLHGKIAIVTGGDSGLGFQAALALAKRGATIVIGNRNAIAGGKVARNISDITGATAAALPLDLGDFESVRRFAETFLRRFDSKLDLLVNCAGIDGPSTLTKDGYELTFQVDYMGPFLLTELLLPALRASAPSRVINVASGSADDACSSPGWPADCLKDFTYLPPPVVHGSLYGLAKFGNVQHAEELARRERRNGVRAFSLSPGHCLTPMTRDEGHEVMEAICKAQVHPDEALPANPCPFAPEQGAAVIAFLATGDDLIDGGYYSRVLACQPGTVTMQGFTEAMRAELYERTARWVGLDIAASDSEVVLYM